jgi:hypothetical protein
MAHHRRRLWVDNLKAELLFEEIEVAVAMQQGMTFQNAKTGDEAVDRLANGMAARPEATIVLRGNDGEAFSASREDGESGELAPDAPEGEFIADALENFTEDEVSQGERPAFKLVFEPVGMRIDRSAEVVDPDSGVDDGRDGAIPSPGRGGIAPSYRPSALCREGGERRPGRES